jgi:hypothetical protein
LRAEVGALRDNLRRESENARLSLRGQEENEKRLLSEIEKIQNERNTTAEKITKEKDLELHAAKAAAQLQMEAQMREYKGKLKEDQEQEIGRRVVAEVFSATKRLEEKNKTERETELQRIKLASLVEIKKHREQMEGTERKMAEMKEELRTAGMAAESFEKEVSALRMQLASVHAQRVNSTRREDRLQAALTTVRSKWADRESDVFEQAQARAMQVLENEKTKLQTEFQEEVERRAAELSQKARAQAAEALEMEKSKLRMEFEREAEQRIAQVSEILAADKGAKSQATIEMMARLNHLESKWTEFNSAQEANAELKQKKDGLDQLCATQAAQLLFVKKELESLQRQIREKLTQRETQK